TVLRAKNVILAGGDKLARLIPDIHAHTATVYTGRVGVGPLDKKGIEHISPSGEAVAFCDTNLKTDDSMLGADFLWVSLHPDGYFAAGFGGCFASLQANVTQRKMRGMLDKVEQKVRTILPFLEKGSGKGQSRHIKRTIGGLNTSTNMLPLVDCLSRNP